MSGCLASPLLQFFWPGNLPFLSFPGALSTDLSPQSRGPPLLYKTFHWLGTLRICSPMGTLLPSLVLCILWWQNFIFLHLNPKFLLVALHRKTFDKFLGVNTEKYGLAVDNAMKEIDGWLCTWTEWGHGWGDGVRDREREEQLGGMTKAFKEQLCSFYINTLPYSQGFLCLLLLFFFFGVEIMKSGWYPCLDGKMRRWSKTGKNSAGDFEHIKDPRIHRHLEKSIGLPTSDGMGVSRKSYLDFRLTSGLH